MQKQNKTPKPSRRRIYDPARQVHQLYGTEASTTLPGLLGRVSAPLNFEGAEEAWQCSIRRHGTAWWDVAWFAPPTVAVIVHAKHITHVMSAPPPKKNVG